MARSAVLAALVRELGRRFDRLAAVRAVELGHEAMLALDHAERAKPRDALGQPCPLDHADDPVDILVGEGGLLREAPRRRRAHHYSRRLELTP